MAGARTAPIASARVAGPWRDLGTRILTARNRICSLSPPPRSVALARTDRTYTDVRHVHERQTWRQPFRQLQAGCHQQSTQDLAPEEIHGRISPDEETQQQRGQEEGGDEQTIADKGGMRLARAAVAGATFSWG